MITEIAQIDVKPGSEKDFEAAVAKARPLFLRAKGGKGFELHKSIEKPSRYRLLAKWETLENHTVDFRGSRTSRHGVGWSGSISPRRPRSNTPRRYLPPAERSSAMRPQAATASGEVSSALK